jgi:hypothetical protein
VVAAWPACGMLGCVCSGQPARQGGAHMH